jgi:hypothetical protein
MNVLKPAAALTSGLLARKGGARPAMRRQPIAGLSHMSINMMEDLGWNDMGVEEPEPDSSPVAAQLASARKKLSAANQPPPAPVEHAPVEDIAPAEPPRATPVIDLTLVRAMRTAGRKSAFTLRIDAERHLRLRLLSAVKNRSAQQLMITALDALIASHPDIATLATDPKMRAAALQTAMD